MTFAVFAAVFMLINLVFALGAVANDPAALWAVVVSAVIGYGIVQAGFHHQISWSPAGVVFRGALLTRVIPWAAVSHFGPGSASVFAYKAERSRFPVAGPEIQVLRTDVLGRRSSPVTRTTDALNDYLAHRLPAVPSADAPRIVTMISRPGRPAIAWLALQAMLLLTCLALLATA
ncbi:MAG TPA: hypothetical protein VFW55_10495 [Propionicimonas sp.]|nr:hypothetical protein [Propionicimonas sp.]